jgi:hypothetical protein
MKKNEGNLDRIVRIVMGVGIVPLMTGLMGFCPMYRIFGVSTCPLHRKH